MKSKKFLSILLALAMTLSLCAAVFADEDLSEDTTGDITGVLPEVCDTTAVDTSASAETAAPADEGESVSLSVDAAEEKKGTPDIVVAEDKTIDKIEVKNGATTVTGDTKNYEINGEGTSPVVHGNVHNPAGIYTVKLEGSGSDVTVYGSVTAECNTDNGAYVTYAAKAGQNTSITIGSDAVAKNENGTGGATAVSADKNSSVKIGGKVEAESPYGDTIGVSATTGVSVIVGEGVKAESNRAVGEAKAIKTSNGASVIIGGDVEASNIKGKATAVDAGKEGTSVKIGGNVEAIGGSSASLAIDAYSKSEVIVEGTVNGKINNNSSTVYVGALADEGQLNAEKNNVNGFLVGLADDTETKTHRNITDYFTSDLATVGGTEDTVKTATGKTYYVADPYAETKTIKLTLNAEQREKYNEIKKGNESFTINENGTCTISYNALGGMNALVLAFKSSGSDSNNNSENNSNNNDSGNNESGSDSNNNSDNNNSNNNNPSSNSNNDSGNNANNSDSNNNSDNNSNNNNPSNSNSNNDSNNNANNNSENNSNPNNNSNNNNPSSNNTNNNNSGSNTKPAGGSSAPAPAAAATETYVVILPFSLESSADGKGLSFNCNTLGEIPAEAELKNVLTVKIDFADVASDAFSAKLNDKGNIDIVFTDAFLATLSGGMHTASVIFNGMTYQTMLNVPYAG